MVIADSDSYSVHMVLMSPSILSLSIESMNPFISTCGFHVSTLYANTNVIRLYIVLYSIVFDGHLKVLSLMWRDRQTDRYSKWMKIYLIFNESLPG